MRCSFAMLLISTSGLAQTPTSLPRARELGVTIGRFETGPRNAITDVAGVAIGHATVIEGETIRTGVTIVHPCFPHNPYVSRVAAAVVTGNGFGKAAGFTQVEELGELEAPIALTNTLAVGTVLDAMVRRMIALPGNESVRSVNVVVGETNDGYLNDIRAFPIRREHVDRAWDALATGDVPEGSVGAGTGTRCFAFKGGIGTSSRIVPPLRFTLGVLVQSNFGGDLRIDGRAYDSLVKARESSKDGSCMIVLATDAPLDARQLKRLARRTLLALPRIGSSMSHGSGDYAIAFSTARRRAVEGEPASHAKRWARTTLDDGALTPLFECAMDATEEAILNSMLRSASTRGHRGEVKAIDPERVRSLAR